MILSIR